MDEIQTNKIPQNFPKFSCEKCGIITNNKKDYTKHLLTAKHKRTNISLPNSPDFPNPAISEKECSNKFSCKCGKKYLHASSLTKHKKTCSEHNPEQSISLEMLMKFLQDNQEFKVLMMEQYKYQAEKDDKILECLKETKTINNINTNCNNNNKFNMNVFLNEKCKDALNIMDFVNQIQLYLSDFESYGEKGYVESISNILIRELKGLDVTKRPIHCSDLKREVMYVKDNNIWEKDNEEKQKIKKAISIIGQKNFKQLQEWKNNNPECIDVKTKKHEQYTKILINSCGSDDKEDDRYFNKIIKNLSTTILINK